MKTLQFATLICIMIIGLAGNKKALAQEQQESVTVSVNCKELGRLNGEVSYSYDATLKNNTAEKLKVTYRVIIKNGDTSVKTHNHSTVLIPDEELTETNDGEMSEEDWDKSTDVWIEYDTPTVL
ncbi:MAG TPA: hypothetical protein PLZ67_01805 [Bacteroidales bacterium]|nr:hypothetical protein [Bacteroidales bacterium]